MFTIALRHGLGTHLPQVEMQDLILALRSLTFGVGFFDWSYDHLQDMCPRSWLNRCCQVSPRINTNSVLHHGRFQLMLLAVINSVGTCHLSTVFVDYDALESSIDASNNGKIVPTDPLPDGSHGFT